MSQDAIQYPPLETEPRPYVGTAAAAYYLNRKMQTLHEWASRGRGLVQPKRIGGRLAWPVAEIKKALGMEA